MQEALKRFGITDNRNIKKDKNGKPFAEKEGVFLSLSHTGKMTLCAVSNERIGADAEKVRPVKSKEKILARFIGEKKDKISDRDFLKKWTQFESRVKFFGESIFLCPRARSEKTVTKTFEVEGHIVSVCARKNQKTEKEKISMAVFYKANILLPKIEDYTKWSVVACDQFTSQPEYWKNVENIVGDSPSTLNLVYPEAFLSEGEERIEKINKEMQRYCDEGLFETYENCLIYVERTLPDGRVRKGVVGAVDLEDYDFNKGAKSPIRATEGTVLERIPPRVKIRENAPLELPHVMLLIDDKEKSLIENIKFGEKLYDFSLMADGGALRGYLVKGENADSFLENIEEFAKKASDGLVFAVGDGNHSLATAKTCWENIKSTLTKEERKTHPARFCLVEIENIHDDVLEFEPIHRAVFGIENKENFKKELIEKLGCKEKIGSGQHIIFVADGEKTDLYIENPSSPIAVGTVQKYLDTLSYEVDYIHGEKVLEELSLKDGTVGILLPKPEKSSLFETVIKDGALPRKTFSMGEANEKRYYTEAKKIK